MCRSLNRIRKEAMSYKPVGKLKCQETKVYKVKAEQAQMPYAVKEEKQQEEIIK